MTTRSTRSQPSTPSYSGRLASHYWLLGNNGDYITNNSDYIGVRFEEADGSREESIGTTWGNRSKPSTTWTTR